MTALFHILAAPATPDQVFKSMGDSMNASVNPLHILSAIALLIGTLVLLSIVTKRRDPRAKPKKQTNNRAKLLREMAKHAGLKSREMKQLKQLAAEQNVENPLVLLICPSVLKKAMEKRQTARR